MNETTDNCIEMTLLRYGSISPPYYHISNASFTVSILSVTSTDYIAIKLIIISMRARFHNLFRHCRVRG